MSPSLAWFVGRASALASLAYAAGMKRLGHRYFFNVVAGVFNSRGNTRVVYGGRMPCAVTTATGTRCSEATETLRRMVE